MLTSIQIIDIARLTENTALSQRDIAKRVGISHQSVGRTQKRLLKKGMTAEQLLEMEPDDVVALRYPNVGNREHNLVEPDWKTFYQETQVKGSTIRFRYIDYAQFYKERAMAYSTVCRGLRDFKKKQKLSMKLIHRAGECIQIDYAGSTLKCPFADKPVQFFCAVHAHSQRFFMLATLRQTSEDWIKGTLYTFKASGGVPEIVISDNAKALVTKAGSMPALNPKIVAFATHHNVVVLPARPGHPQDKALVEASVKLFTESILPLLKRHVFSSLDDLNAFLEKLVDEYNARLFQKRDTSRQALFEQYDLPMLSALPPTDFKPIERILNFVVPEDYRFMLDEHTYSVPHSYRHKRVQVHVLAEKVQVWDQHKLVVEHTRSFEKGGDSILDEHLHPDHLWFTDKPKEYYQEWADSTFDDDAVSRLIGHFFTSKHVYSRIGNTRARQIQDLASDYTPEDFVAACRYALNTNQVRNMEMLKFILKSEVYKDQEVELPETVPGALLRGGDYYASKGVRT